MKTQLLRIGVVAIAMSACLAFSQVTHPTWQHTTQHSTKHNAKKIKAKKAKARTYTIHHRGGIQTITYYTHDRRTGRAIRHTRRVAQHRKPRTFKEAVLLNARNRRHHRTWKEAVTSRRNRGHHRTHRVATRRHDNGLHRGWYIGKGNPHRIGSKKHHGTTQRKHRNKRDGHSNRGEHHSTYIRHDPEYALAQPGYQLASYQVRRYPQRRTGGNRRGLTRYYAAGHYSNLTRWSRRNEHFTIKYVINLSSDHSSRLEATSIEDRNMPNDRANTNRHGDILGYMHTGHDVIQNGDWTQDGTRITIRLNRIRYGRTTRTKNETLRGHLNGSNLMIDSYDREFYGSQFNPAFRKD